PLLETTVAGATGVLLNITGGPDLGLFEIDEAAGIIRQAAADDCNVIFGAVIDEGAGDHVRGTGIATGFDGAAPAERPEERRAVGRAANGRTESGLARPDLSLGREERESFRVPDDALEVPDFLKGR